MKKWSVLAGSLIMAVGVGAAHAQTTNANASATPAAAQQPGTATVKSSGAPPSERNPLLADNGDVRMSKLVGTDIYNKQDKQVGSVDDVLASPNGQLEVVVDTNKKKVLVPWNALQFGDAKLNSDNKVLMPSATQDTLNSEPTFSYKHE